MKPSFAFDTSSLVSLGHTDVIRKVIDNFEIIITETILDELLRVISYSDSHSKAAMKWMNHRAVFRIRQVKEKKKHGEDELFIICKKENLILVCDDIKALKRYDGQVRWFFSVNIIHSLKLKNVITREEARKSFRTMREERNWKDNLIYTTGRILIE